MELKYECIKLSIWDNMEDILAIRVDDNLTDPKLRVFMGRLKWGRDRALVSCSELRGFIRHSLGDDRIGFIHRGNFIGLISEVISLDSEKKSFWEKFKEYLK